MFQQLRSFLSRHLLHLLFVVEAIILILAVAGYIRHTGNLLTLHYSSEDLQSYTADTSPDCFGGTISEAYASGLYDAIPSMELRKGYYQYTVTYSSNSAGSFIWPHSYSENYNLMDQVVVSCQDGIHTATKEFWLNADTSLALRVNYSGTGFVTISDFEIRETRSQANMDLLSTLVFLLVVNAVVYLLRRRKTSPLPNAEIYTFLALVCIGLAASYPYLVGYLLNGHDLGFHLTRIEGLAEGLSSGQFPVRINPTFYNGYGYANPIFYGEILLYFPALLRLLGFRLSTCYLVYGVVINLLTAFLTYYCFEKMWKDRLVSLACSLVYTLAPYRILDTYLRAAVGEYTSMAFLPLVVYGMYRIYTEDPKDRKYRWSFLPLVIGLTGILQTHVLTGEVTAGVMLLTCLILIRKTLKPRRLLALLKAAGLTILLNIWFLVPFLDYSLTQDIRILQATTSLYLQHTGVKVSQLMNLFLQYNWNPVEATSGVVSSMPVTLGLPLMLGLVLFLALFLNTTHDKANKIRGGLLFLLSVITLWMATCYFPWDRFSDMSPVLEKLISSLQFAWRMFSPATVLAAACTGYGLILLRREDKNRHFLTGAVTALTLLTLVSTFDYMEQCLHQQSPLTMNTIADYGMDTQATASGGEYVLCDASYEDVTQNFEPRPDSGIVVTAYEKSGTNITLTVNGGQDGGHVLLPLLAYKGYALRSEDGSLDSTFLSQGRNAVLQVYVPAGYTGTLYISFKGMWYWRAAEAVSLLTLAGLLFFYFKDKKKDAQHAIAS